MKKSLVLLSILFGIFILIINFVNADILINEVMPHSNNTYVDEWIELYNSGSENISLDGWLIGDMSSNDTFSINISAGGYGMIVDSGGNGCGSLNISSDSCVTLTTLGSGLNDGGDSIFLFNISLISNFTWVTDIQSIGKSFGYSSGTWQNCTPTPGAANNCTQPTQTCTQTSICGDWSSCSSSSTKTRSCTNTSTSCTSNAYTETSSCTYTNTTTSSAYVLLNWSEEDIINKEEFDIEVKAYNLLSGDYDIKVEMHFTENTTGISERYDESEDEWKSGTYYINNFFSGAGNRTEDIKIRLKEEYLNFYGEVKIQVKLRKGESIINEKEYYITVLKQSVSNSSTTSSEIQNLAISTTSSNQDNSEAIQEVIVLGSSNSVSKPEISKSDNSIIYKSKTEYIKQYIPYVFSLVCIVIIILLLVDKKQHGK